MRWNLYWLLVWTLGCAALSLRICKQTTFKLENKDNLSETKQVIHLKLQISLKLDLSLPPSLSSVRSLPKKWYRRSIRCWWTARTPATAPASHCSWTEMCWTTLQSSSPSRACRRARCSKWWKVRVIYFFSSYLGLSARGGAKRKMKASFTAYKKVKLWSHY